MGAMKKTEQLRKVAEGREAEMFAWGEGAILRLLRDADAGRRNEWQAAAMEAARSSGVRVPAVLEATTVMGRPGLVMERIEGTDLLTLVGRRPWTLFRAARISVQLHASLHEVKAPESLPPLRATLGERIESSTAALGEHTTFALDLLAGLPDGDRLCHGDFHPGNIMMDGSTPVLIDWTNAMRGEPTADVARTHLMLRLGEVPPGTSVPLRVMAAVGRSALVWLYIRGYRRLRPLDMALLARWEIVHAAARVADGIEGEVPALLRFLERARRSAG